jgi:S-adenosylmethionine synthetase
METVLLLALRKERYLMPTLYRTAESVSPKHPDKICDQISDAILDAYLKEDPYARVAIDVAGAHGKLFIAGELTSVATSVDIFDIAHRIAGPKADGTPLEIIESIEAQSPEIAQGVNTGGAGDQGIMVGYATDETPELLPLEYVLARNLNKYLYKQWPYDGKTQVTTKNGEVIAIVASFQHAPQKELSTQVLAWAKEEPLATLNEIEFALHANPAGDWEVGGFDADSGLTGRKLAVDNYGPRVPLGGGAFSGKDGTKVDRSGAYIARQIAVDYLKKSRAHEVYVYLAYAIGYPQPVEATVIVDGVQRQIKGYDLTPEGIIKKLNLRAPGFEARARYGHF